MFSHLPVMPNEVLDLLSVENPFLYVDFTSGGGGHAELFFNKYPNMRLLLLDRDEDAIVHLKNKFAGENRVIVAHYASSELEKVLFLTKNRGADIILGDLGVSSYQFDEGERGFSFRFDAFMDMRMDRTKGFTAVEMLKDIDEKELVWVLSNYGEERESKRVAALLKKLAAEGETSTVKFAEEIVKIKKHSKSKIHPATQVFQALRIAVNGEMEELDKMLESGFEKLMPCGKMGFITFHSLEDRKVKRFFQSLREGDPLTGQPLNDINILKAISPSDEECRENPRSRSAKLRVVKKLS